MLVPVKIELNGVKTKVEVEVGGYTFEDFYAEKVWIDDKEVDADLVINDNQSACDALMEAIQWELDNYGNDC